MTAFPHLFSPFPLRPAGTPEPVVERINALFSRGVADPAVRARAEGLGARLTGLTPAAYAEWMARE